MLLIDAVDSQLAKVYLSLKLRSLQLANSLLKSLVLAHRREKEGVKMLQVSVGWPSIRCSSGWSASINYFSYRGNVTKLRSVLSPRTGIVTFVNWSVICRLFRNSGLLHLIFILIQLAHIDRPAWNWHLGDYVVYLILSSFCRLIQSGRRFYRVHPALRHLLILSMSRELLKWPLICTIQILLVNKVIWGHH